MTEATQVNDAVRHNLGPLGRFIRIEDRIAVGVPDWHYTMFSGASGWIEDKLIPRSGRCPAKFTLDQLVWGEEEVRCGGRWFLLGLREPRTWVLYDATRAREWFDGTVNRPIIETVGKFPTREIARALRGDRERCPSPAN